MYCQEKHSLLVGTVRLQVINSWINLCELRRDIAQFAHVTSKKGRVPVLFIRPKNRMEYLQVP